MDVAIVVSSCDYFQDCWSPFIYSVKKNWTDCEWPIYIISNYNEIESCDGISFIKVGDDKKFASNLKYALSKINAAYIIYLQEDYFLNRKVNNTSIKNHIEYCLKNQIDYMRLGFPFIKGKLVDNIYVENDMLEKYALCLQAAIWKKNKFESILLDNWSGWDFERNIQRYIKDKGIVFKVFGLCSQHANDKGINYVTGTAVRKGLWTRAGYDFLKKEGFDELLTSRAKEGWLFSHLQETTGIFRVPCLIIVKIMKLLNWNF